MYQQEFDVVLDGHTEPVRVVADQRDLAQLELQPWHGTGKQMLTVRHMAWTAMVRAKQLPPHTSFERFNTGLCVDVVGVADPEDEEPALDEDPEGEQGLDPGRTTTPDTSSSSSPSSPASPSRGRRGSKAGTPGTSTP